MKKNISIKKDLIKLGYICKLHRSVCQHQWEAKHLSNCIFLFIVISGDLIQQCIITVIEPFYFTCHIEAQRSLSLKLYYGLCITESLFIVGVLRLFLIQRNSESLYCVLRGATVDMNTGDVWCGSGSSIMNYF